MEGVDCDLKREYSPDRSSEGVCKHVWLHLLWLAVATCFVMTGMWIDLQYLYPNVRNPLERWLCEGGIHVGWAWLVMNWGLWFLQCITNGNLLKRTLQYALASALVLAAYLLCLAYIVASV
jgi:hypothetical protein